MNAPQADDVDVDQADDEDVDEESTLTQTWRNALQTILWRACKLEKR